MISSPNCSFVLSVEQGKLEAQAILLAESLRTFGGRYANAPVYAISPRPARRMGDDCAAKLKSLRVNVIFEDLLPKDEAYGTRARLACCVWAEQNLMSEILISLDNDMFFVQEPDFGLQGIDFLARPVDIKGICTTGPGDPRDAYWQRVARVAGVGYEEIIQVETTVDRVRVKASYNGGMVAVRRNQGIFTRASEIFNILKEQDLAPYRLGEHNVYASMGYVGGEASRWWGSAQIILSLAVTQKKARIGIAPSTYNMPAHSLQEAASLGNLITLKNAVLVHYHWLLEPDHIKTDELFYGSADLPPEILAWLRHRVPLGTIPHQAERKAPPGMLEK